jgi:hypothetical protein
VAPGDEFFDESSFGGCAPSCINADTEHMTVVQVTPVSGTVFDAWVLRDTGNGYACLISQHPNSPGECSSVDAQALHSNGWYAWFVPRGSAGFTVNQFFDTNNPASVVTENGAYTRSHFGYALSSNGNMNFLGSNGFYYASRFDQPISNIGAYNAYYIPYAPSFAGVTLDTSAVQSYAHAGIGGIGTDWRHVNGGLGLAVEYPNQTVGPVLAFTAVSGQTNTWKVSGFAAPSVKSQPLQVYAGTFLLADMSSSATGNLITDANTWKYCYAYRANECRSGSSSGDLYVVVPELETSVNQCNASQVPRRILCVFPAGPLMSQVTQMDTTKSDVSAFRQRRLGPNLTNPGAQYVYSGTKAFSATRPLSVFATQYHLGGLWTGAALIDPGGWDKSSQAANDFVKVPVTIPPLAGTNQARIRFGYADYGTAGTPFQCTSRQEDCLTDATLSPFAFAGDTLTAANCSSGCTIQVPVPPGRIVLYRVERLNSGILIPADPTIRLAAVD